MPEISKQFIQPIVKSFKLQNIILDKQPLFGHPFTPSYISNI